MLKIFWKFFTILFAMLAWPQVLMAADYMRQIGKIRVVVGVIGVVFFGLIAFLIYLERRINKIEKTINDE